MRHGNKASPNSSNSDTAQDLSILQHLEDIIWTCDANFKLTYVSPAIERVTGFTVEERMSMPLEEVLTAASIETLHQMLTEQAATDDSHSGPIRCNLEAYCKDGSSYLLEASLSIIRNELGEITGIVGSNRNITERNRATSIIKAIHNSTFLVTGDQYLNDLVLQLSATLSMRYAFIAKVSDGISQTLAFCERGQLGDNFSYHLSGSPCENVVAGTICFFPENVTELYPHEKGLKRMGVNSYIGTPIPDPKGEVQGLLVLMDDKPLGDVPLLRRVLEVCADRTGAEMSRRETQNRLEESEQRFRALFEQSLDPCLIHDPRGLIINANQSMLDTFGYKAEELAQLNAIHLSTDNTSDKANTKAAVQKVFTTGASRFETRLKKKSGEDFPAEITTQIIQTEDEHLVLSIIRDLTEQYRLRDQEQSTQQTLAKLFNAMHTMIAMLNTNGCVTYANTTVRTNSDALHAMESDTKLWDFQAFNYDPVVQELIKENIATALDGKETQSDVQVLTPVGLLWMQVNIYPVSDNKGQVSQLLVEGTDIDQHKKLAEQILAEQHRRKLFREQAPMPVIEWDPNGPELTEWNDAAQQLFGFSAEEVRGQGPNFLTPEGINVDSRNIVKNLNSGHGKTISKNRCKDGRIILCEWYNSPIKDSTGKMIAVVSIVRDITAEHRAQRMLQSRDAEQRAILDTILDAVFTLDENSNLLSFNKAAETLFGHAASDIIGQSCWQLLPEQYIPQHRHYMQRYLETEDLKYLGISGDLEGLRKDGTTFPSRMAIAPLGNKTGTQQKFIVSMQNLSKAKQQEEQLRRSQKMDALGKLTGGIAHDFNNMLGVIMGYADLLQASMKDQPKLEQYAEEIYRAGHRGAQLTEKLLGFSRQKLAAAEQLSINTVLLDQQHMLAKAITPRINLVYDLEDELWPVYLDSGDLLDAILNISINAMHAMPEGGELSIATHNEQVNELDAPIKGLPKGDYVLLSISDTGCGMDQQTQEKIFDPFFSTKGKLGTGLGLSQVYGFVERSKGSIRIYSEPGHGTRLTLYFPRHRDIDVQAKDTSPSPPLAVGGKETILVVDDEPALLDLSTEILSQQGYQVIPVTSGQQALEVLNNTPVNLLLSDVIMPDMDGYQLAATVQAQHPDVKIQLASGFTDNRHSDKLSSDLIDNILQKPFNIKSLLTRIRRLLDE